MWKAVFIAGIMPPDSRSVEAAAAEQLVGDGARKLRANLPATLRLLLSDQLAAQAGGTPAAGSWRQRRGPGRYQIPALVTRVEANLFDLSPSLVRLESAGVHSLHWPTLTRALTLAPSLQACFSILTPVFPTICVCREKERKFMLTSKC